MGRPRRSPPTSVSEVNSKSRFLNDFRDAIDSIKKIMDGLKDGMVQILKDGMEKIRESMIAEIKKLQSEMSEINSVLSEVKGSFEGSSNRVTVAEGKIDKLQDDVQQVSRQEKKLQEDLRKSKQQLRIMCAEFRRNNIRIIGVPEEQECEFDEKTLVKNIIDNNFPELKLACIQIQEARRIPAKIDPNRKTPRHIVIKMTTSIDRDRILSAARSRKELTYKGTPIRFTADLANETLEARKEWWKIVEKLKEINASPKILFPARLSFKFEGKRECFFDKDQLREFIASKPILQETLTELL